MILSLKKVDPRVFLIGLRFKRYRKNCHSMLHIGLALGRRVVAVDFITRRSL